MVSELTHWFDGQGIDIIFLTTQSTNRVVLRVWEKLNYQYGRCTHVWSLHAKGTYDVETD